MVFQKVIACATSHGICLREEDMSGGSSVVAIPLSTQAEEEKLYL
jgi:hypothetical protein